MEKHVFECFDDLPHLVYLAAREHVVDLLAYASADAFQEGDEPIISGYIRFDGCSDWFVSGCHCCDRQQVVDLGNLLPRCYDLAAKHCPAWDGD